MKNRLFIYLIMFGLGFIACKKNETQPISENKRSESIEKETQILKNSNGDQLKVTYFVENNMIAVRIQKNEESEHKLTAKLTSESGNPIFTDDVYMWEMNTDITSGKLTNKDGSVSEFVMENK